ncbi:MAG TPA: PfkB family carbohydrate kinase [Microlunatus sp.]|nr:PfkB family carbohydrate kinase [Microlunatus sp.]
MTTRFVVCGETLIDLIQADDQPEGFVSSAWSAMSAGGPMNSAVALGDLGADVHFLGRLSRDAFGAQLRGHIEGAGVALDLATESSQATSLAVVSLDDDGKASYTFHFSDTANFGWEEADLPTLSADDWLHIASLACVVSPGSDVLLDWAHGVPAGISYDINVRPTVITEPEEYWAKVRPWLRVIGQHKGILKASDEDVEFLAQVESPGADPVEALTGWVTKYGIGLGVVTLGPGGAVAVGPDGEQTSVPGFPTTVVDTVGAGDTFMAGFLDGYVGRSLDLRTSLTRGAAAASIVCSRRGAQPPTSAEVDALIEAM